MAGARLSPPGANLHASARQIDQLGSFPESLGDLLTLPGVGPYTARAVLAFAFERDVAVVDTNVARVLARVHGRSFSAREVQAIANSLVPAGEGWLWNQTMLDIGALRCRPNAPICADCPMVSQCAWKGSGPDPAIGSAGVSVPQARFEGSNRQARGRLLRRLGAGAIARGAAPAVMGIDPDRAEMLVSDLIAEGLVTGGDVLSLP